VAETDQSKLAREVIEKYGVDADKPSVHLARAVLALEKRAVETAEILTKVNEALNRAGFYAAEYYWDVIDRLAKERDELRSSVEIGNQIVKHLSEVINTALRDAVRGMGGR